MKKQQILAVSPYVKRLDSLAAELTAMSNNTVPTVQARALIKRLLPVAKQLILRRAILQTRQGQSGYRLVDQFLLAVETNIMAYLLIEPTSIQPCSMFHVSRNEMFLCRALKIFEHEQWKRRHP